MSRVRFRVFVILRSSDPHQTEPHKKIKEQKTFNNPSDNTYEKGSLRLIINLTHMYIYMMYLNHLSSPRQRFFLFELSHFEISIQRNDWTKFHDGNYRKHSNSIIFNTICAGSQVMLRLVYESTYFSLGYCYRIQKQRLHSKVAESTFKSTEKFFIKKLCSWLWVKILNELGLP